MVRVAAVGQACIVGCIVGCIVVACAPPPQPVAAPAAEATPPPAQSAAPDAGTAAAPEEPVAPKARPLDLTNTCSRAMHLYYGPSPGDPRGQSATVPAGATVPVPRGPDGTVTVWIVDEGGRGLASVSVRRRMTHVQIDPACSRIDAT